MTNDDDGIIEGAAGCHACPLHEASDDTADRAVPRRDFLRVAGFGIVSLGLLGTRASVASALPMRSIAAAACRDGTAGREERRYPFPAADGVFIDKDNSVIIARTAGKVFAFSLACPHQNTALRWNPEDHEFQCPKHKSHYRPDGAFIEGRATRDMDRLGVRRDGAFVVVNLDAFFQEDLNRAQWAAAYVSVEGSTPC